MSLALAKAFSPWLPATVQLLSHISRCRGWDVLCLLFCLHTSLLSHALSPLPLLPWPALWWNGSSSHQSSEPLPLPVCQNLMRSHDGSGGICLRLPLLGL